MRFPAHGIRLGLPAAALASDVVVYARGADSFGRNLDGIERLTRPVRVGPVGWVLQAPMLVHVDVAHPGEHESIYRFDDYRRSWTFMPSIADSTGWSARSEQARRVRGVPRRCGAENQEAITGAGALVGDRRARDASCAFPSVMKARASTSRAAWCGWADAEASSDGDFVGKKLVVPLNDTSIIGKQSVSVVAFDRSGNRVVAQRHHRHRRTLKSRHAFTIRPSARAFQIQPARRLDQGRRSRAPGQRARHAGGGAHRSRQHARCHSLLSRGEESRNQARRRHRGIHYARQPPRSLGARRASRRRPIISSCSRAISRGITTW